MLAHQTSVGILKDHLGALPTWHETVRYVGDIDGWRRADPGLRTPRRQQSCIVKIFAWMCRFTANIWARNQRGILESRYFPSGGPVPPSASSSGYLGTGELGG